MKVVPKEIKKTAPLNGDQYYPTVNEKTQIFLHHTAGLTAKGAIDWWNQTPDHVGTAFVIERDGTIFQTFDPMKWGYHLGIKGDDDYCEKHSIGIEIVSGGHLYLKDKTYMFYPLYPRPLGGKEIPEWDICKLDHPFRKFSFFHKYTDAQIESLIYLIHYITQTFGVKLQQVLGKFWEYNPKVISDKLPGIWSHTTVREDKDDIYPDPNLIKALEEYIAEYHTPKVEIEESQSPQDDEDEKKPRGRRGNK